MREEKYRLDAEGNPVPCADFVAWAIWMESTRATRARVVAQSRDERQPPDDPNAVLISTVFLGRDHGCGDGPPVLWETLVFGGVLDGEMDRYTSKQAALEGHQKMCERVNNTGQQDAPDKS